MSVRKACLAVALAVIVSGCGEVTIAKYADRNDALAREAIGESKWLPAWLPEGAVAIRETHDVDTNESWLVFRLNGDKLTLPSKCELADKPAMTEKRVMSRFPQFAQDAWSRASEHTGEFYRCPESSVARWVMHDEELGLVYSWVKF
ncbi:hypothetical protein [Pseudoxanthomonas broegbernensis]|uniref:hypothetical protein n=1 Tax=Pseudoxanthomonas broegbernensis TaxID=83619 RepID=UPI0013909D38|nr:hypothetical protein [Pseudoxanthomonas broegbernensis]MBB6066273.1 hypothetical protein [Pseudoxanthomonas broegbernensis]